MMFDLPRYNMLWFRVIMLALVIILGSGCAAIPPLLQQVSMVASGVSYVATSKGPSDHAISSIAKKDCSLMRLLVLKPMCVHISDETNRSLWSKIVKTMKKSVIGEPIRPGAIRPGEVGIAYNDELSVHELLDISKIDMSLVVAVNP